MNNLGDLGDAEKVAALVATAEAKLIDATVSQFIPALREATGAAVDKLVEGAAVIVDNNVTRVKAILQALLAKAIADGLPALTAHLRDDVLDGLVVTTTVTIEITRRPKA